MQINYRDGRFCLSALVFGLKTPLRKNIRGLIPYMYDTAQKCIKIISFVCVCVCCFLSMMTQNTVSEQAVLRNNLRPHSQTLSVRVVFSVYRACGLS